MNAVLQQPLEPASTAPRSLDVLWPLVTGLKPGKLEIESPPFLSQGVMVTLRFDAKESASTLRLVGKQATLAEALEEVLREAERFGMVVAR